MSTLKAFHKDPRTVAREIPGVFDAIFPQLSPSVVAYFNATRINPEMCDPIDEEVVESSSLAKAMLFELAIARAELLMEEHEPNDVWTDCLNTALLRQKVYFDAQLPDYLEEDDKIVAEQIAQNLVDMLRDLERARKSTTVVQSPTIPGFQWIATGNGDFSLGATIIEVKCGRRNFSAADYRQVLIYWLLSYLSSLEADTVEYTEIILINPRRNQVVALTIEEMLRLVASGRSKIEIAQMFSSLVSEHVMRLANE